MAKRFHDTGIWDKEWFMKLSSEEKCAFFYIKDKCDNVGVWAVSQTGIDYNSGKHIDLNDFLKKCNGNFVVLDNGKWWISDFCDFQYPELTDETTSKPLMSYIKTLKKHGLWEKYLGIDNL